jgi:hypothetical protein
MKRGELASLLAECRDLITDMDDRAEATREDLDLRSRILDALDEEPDPNPLDPSEAERAERQERAERDSGARWGRP